jgi:hypothetical protein
MGASSKEVPTAFEPLRQVLGLRCRYLRRHRAPRNTCLLLRVGNQGACRGLPFARAALSTLAQLGISLHCSVSRFPCSGRLSQKPDLYHRLRSVLPARYAQNAVNR